ncbi:MAG: hypothetical protein IT357_02530 [Gemmatimonadaceae bacterium]|nr:hypothetical protein [Gemmatimonadaceae bacterium]
MNGRSLVGIWLLWIAATFAVARLFDGIGVAIPLPTSMVVAISERFSFVVPLLFFSPPLVLTLLWWRRSR